MILERKTNYPAHKPGMYRLDYSKQGACLRCDKIYDRYEFSGIMISLCKDCRYADTVQARVQ